MIELDKEYTNWKDQHMPDVNGSREYLDNIASALGEHHYINNNEPVEEIVREFMGDDIFLEKLNEDQREYLFERVQYHSDFSEYLFTKDVVSILVESEEDINKEQTIEAYNLDEETFDALIEFFHDDC